jgi:glycosyltransferase involved in cell wall biosynthesis
MSRQILAKPKGAADFQTNTDASPWSFHPQLAGRSVLFVVNDPAFFLSHRLILARALMRNGARCFLAAPNEPSAERVSQVGIEFLPLSMSRWSASPRELCAGVLELTRIYRTLRPDIVHHVTIKPLLLGGIAAKFAKIPATVNAVSGLGHVFLSRGPLARVRRMLVSGMYRAALRHPNQGVIFQNPDDAEEFIKRGWISRKATKLIPGSGVDLQSYAPSVEPSGEPLVLLPARLLRAKGVYEFAEAARLLKLANIEARFVLVGELPAGNPDAVRIEDINLWQNEGVLEYWEHRDDMAKLMSDSHIICLPSYREGLPKALVEAAASGRAIVSTDVPGCREIARHRRNALLVPAESAVQLAMALRELIENPELRVSMGEEGRRIVCEEGFSEYAVAKRTLEVYEGLL